MYQQATLESKKAIELDPNNATYHWQLAVIYEKMGKLSKAINEYKQVIRIIPGHTKARQAIKKLKEKLKNKD